MSNSDVRDAIARLDNWLTGNGWAGYDPYDLKGLPGLLHPTQLPGKLFRRTVLGVEYLFPQLVRQLFRVPKSINAKAMGLFAEGYRQLYQATGEPRHLERAKQAIDWLLAHPSPGYAGLCWGYPFDWQSRVLIPRGTPSSVVSSTVGHALWGFYEMTHEPRYLEACQSICEFFTHDLNRDRLDDKRLCFSYTPVDHFHVHNANLFVADFLIRVGQQVSNADYVNLGMQAAAYTLSQQNSDGSICYWGREQDDVCRIDHYHSGFELRCLHGIWKSTQDDRVRQALQAYYAFYKERLFEGQAIPKMTPKSLYPVNIHSCAEAILCHSTLAQDFPEAQEYLRQCVPWIIKTMQHPDGWFIYMILNIKGRLRWKVQIPYIRWGQAWMLRALAAYLKTCQEVG